jgi:hypothetical protein
MLLESLTFPLAQSYFCYYFCHSEEAGNIDRCLVRTTLANEESLVSEKLGAIFLPLQARSDNHCRFETKNSSVAVVSINKSENVFF